MLGLCFNSIMRPKVGVDFGPAIPAAPPHAPAGIRIYAVGDIHGEIALLDDMLRQIQADAAQAVAAGLRPVVVFLGDYVDRGADSRAVIDRLAGLDDGGVDWRFLSGNHEAALLAFLDQPDLNGAWLAYGGAAAVASYGVMPPAPGASPSRLRACRDALRQALPDRHLSFLQNLQSYAILGDYVFVHAGLRPGVAIKDQDVRDLWAIRDEFLNFPVWHGNMVVHGHTISDGPDVLPWRIGIDTGAYASGRLCCLVAEGEHVRFLFATHGVKESR